MEFGYSVRQCADGGYMLLGSTESFGTGDRDIYLVRTDAHGDTVWTRTYGRPGMDAGTEVELTADGGAIFCGLSGEGSVVTKVSALGAVEWSTDLPDRAYALVEASQGDHLVVGMTWLGGADYDMFATRLTAAGTQVWTHTYGTFEGSVALADDAHDVAATADGGFVLFGSGRYSFSLGMPSDHFLVRIDAEGDTLWTRTYGGPGNESGFSEEELDNGGFILLGNSNHGGDYVYDVILVDEHGAVEWSRTLDGEGGADEGYEIRQTPDGGFAFAGRIVDADTEQSSAYLVKMTETGDTAWTRTFRQGQATGLDLTTDGGYAIIGFTASQGAGMNDIYLIKTDVSGTIVGQGEPVPHKGPGLTIFPNPVSERSCIRFLDRTGPDAVLEVVDPAGRIVRAIRIGATDSYWLDRRDLPAGCYRVMVRDAGSRMAQGLLILD